MSNVIAKTGVPLKDEQKAKHGRRKWKQYEKMTIRKTRLLDLPYT